MPSELRVLRRTEPDHTVVMAPPRSGMMGGLLPPILPPDPSREDLLASPTRRTGELEGLAAILVVPPGGRLDHWYAEARRLFVGLALHVLDTPSVPSTVGEMVRRLRPGYPLEAELERARGAGAERDADCSAALEPFLRFGTHERDAVRATLAASLRAASPELNLRDLVRIPLPPAVRHGA